MKILQKKSQVLILLLAVTFGYSQNTYVPDDNFEQALIDLGYDTGALDDYVPTANINTVTSLNVNAKNIADLRGIGDFTALTQLRCGNNNLTSLDVNTNTALTTLWCSNNNLTSLAISANTALTTLRCSNNQLTSLDVSTNTVLIDLVCYNNQLASLDVANNTALTILWCSTNQLTSLNVVNSTALTVLSCSNNNLTSLDVTANIALVQLNCRNNQLTSLNVANGNNTNITSFIATINPNLTCIQVDDATWSTTNWTSIDLASSFSTNCNYQTYVPDDNFEQALIDLGYDTGALDDYVPTANINTVTYLNVGAKNIADLTGIEDFVALTQLYCFTNQLTSLDVSANTALTHLSCYTNQLTSFDVSANTTLTVLSCSNNNLTSLDVTTNTALEKLFCQSNQFTSLNLAANTSLTHLYCFTNQLTSLDVSANTALIDLRCGNTNLTSLDVTTNIALEELNCQNNQLTSLNVANGNYSNLFDFDATNNPNLTCIQVDDVAYSTANWTNIDATSSFSTNCTLSTNDFELKDRFSVYPNPTNGEITIDLKKIHKQITISVTTILGQEIVTQKYQYSNKITLTLNEKTGIYFVTVSTEKGKLPTTKIVKH